ncbi:putative Calnexin Flags: Precursor [Monoraphidium neglectum]|uniref:Calnexin n=1 Tax=Monoraphidium neglectum TaxID=145388 RepID=A0A0D2KG26_9CHLO|nr:putative Calnexin Flags: Precursor [Monoraphidium neglectum]KIY94823.1 putative Calnexin Flags: Precursor [Monoraphidium neglectum]|eukprot:XP_013893843.1 putative Calnexin Flags: Precursor [Monoraphidium neglectum]
MAITVPEPNKHYAMAALLPFPLAPESGLIVQYEAQTAQTHGCGGAYMKLLSPPDGWAPQRLRSRTPYSIMFGPDRCGAAARVHLILKCFNPALGATTEHHLASPPPPPNDRLPHIYTLMLSKEGRYRVLIDGEERAAGGLLDDGAFEPPLRPPKRIPDASDEKPLAWDEREEIDDVRAVKPSDWDNRKMIVDPDAVMPAGWLEGEPTHLLDEGVPKPRDWDDARDGVWMPPEGEWKPRLIKNPAYFEGQSVDAPLKRIAPIRAVAFEIWTTGEPSDTRPQLA